MVLLKNPVPLKNSTIIMQIREAMREPDLTDPDIAGEILRNTFFISDGYRNLDDVAENVRVLDTTSVEDDPGNYWNNYVLPLYKGGIWMSWYWDGDGILKFTFVDGSVLINYDCKKASGWIWEYPNA